MEANNSDFNCISILNMQQNAFISSLFQHVVNLSMLIKAQFVQ